MDDDKLIQTLHPYERKVINVLQKFNTLSEIAEETGLKEVEAMRGFQWLENKGLVKISEDIKELINLDDNGKKYLKEGLPEKRFLMAVGKDTPISSIIKKANITEEEISPCLGVLKGKAAIMIKKDKELLISLLPQGQKLLEKESLEEQFIKKKFPLELKGLKDEEKFALESLKKRKNIIKIERKKIKKATLTELGKKLLSKGIKLEEVSDRLTPQMLKDGSWAKKKFRHYDIKINVPIVFGGKKQHYNKFLDEVRNKFLALGFKEMFGQIVETEFWDMDALFMPQFHSARDIHAAYYIKEPKYGKVDETLLEKVKD